MQNILYCINSNNAFSQGSQSQSPMHSIVGRIWCVDSRSRCKMAKSLVLSSAFANISLMQHSVHQDLDGHPIEVLPEERLWLACCVFRCTFTVGLLAGPHILAESMCTLVESCWVIKQLRGLLLQGFRMYGARLKSWSSCSSGQSLWLGCGARQREDVVIKS